MNIAIIGAGFTGLSAAYTLTKMGHDVTVFEKEPHVGGLALGYKKKEWEWSLEAHYHHWFTNDRHVLGLAKEIGHTVIIKRPKSSIYVDGDIFQFDSPREVLRFPKLSPAERLRMAVVAGLIRYNPFWKPLERFNASTFLPKTMGQKAYKMIWEPQFLNKFGTSADDVSLAWLWARLAKRTPSLAYPEGGFMSFLDHLQKAIEERGGKFIFNAEITNVKDAKKTTISYHVPRKGTVTTEFDKVLFTLSSFLFLKIAPQLPKSYIHSFQHHKNLGATNLILRLKRPFLPNDTYWLSICDTTSPIMAVVEHTNFMDKSHYNDEHLLYLGNYYETDNPLYRMNQEEKLNYFDPFLKKLNPNYREHLIGYDLFTSPYAQPVIPTNYSKMIPPITTPLPNVYLANMQQVYPWDRGTNFAVELGEKAAKMLSE